jgi:hypothetical protein
VVKVPVVHWTHWCFRDVKIFRFHLIASLKMSEELKKILSVRSFDDTFLEVIFIYSYFFLLRSLNLYVTDFKSLNLVQEIKSYEICALNNLNSCEEMVGLPELSVVGFMIHVSKFDFKHHKFSVMCVQ